MSCAEESFMTGYLGISRTTIKELHGVLLAWDLVRRSSILSCMLPEENKR